jgi:peptide/nickel transport system permease protein
MVADVYAESAAPSPARRGFAWRRTARRNAKLILGLTILGAVAGGAALAPWIAPYDPNAMDLGAALSPPSAEHWFGADQLGRDVFSRTLFGGQLSLFIAFSVAALAGTSGVLLGIVAGYRGGWIDGAIMRLSDIQYALPPVILAMVMVGALGPSTVNIVIVIALAKWARFARVIRSEALTLRHRDFVLLARLAGASHLRVALLHILPNVRNTLLVLLTLDLGLIIILEATLSFLGLGVQPPDPSWGTMIADGRGYLERAWWMSTLPGLVLTATVLAANLLGDALRENFGRREDGL